MLQYELGSLGGGKKVREARETILSPNAAA